MSMVFIYTTCRDTAEAKKLGKMMLEKHLAACVNIFPIESMYPWEGKLEDGKEAVLIIKTHEPKVAEIEELIIANHSYSMPFVGVIEARRLNRSYREWMGTVIS